MNPQDILKRYEGSKIDMATLSKYEREALSYFHNGQAVFDPNIDITLQLDITDLNATYHERHSTAKGATLTSYLYWRLIQAMKLHPRFWYRDINGDWYLFKNLPLVFPVAVGGKERLQDVTIEGVCKMDWNTFSATYRDALDNARSKQAPFQTAGFLWNFAILIVNLPKLQFTSLRIQSVRERLGRPAFCFGRRYESGGRLLTPFYVQSDHANLDPIELDAMITDLLRDR